MACTHVHCNVPSRASSWGFARRWPEREARLAESSRRDGFSRGRRFLQCLPSFREVVALGLRGGEEGPRPEF